jgi:hypothetical protein
MNSSQRLLTGGCQCGAVRYEWLRPPTRASVCYCRMCQKASGQPFMAFTGAKASDLRWTRGEPTFFQSSDVAERGFCSACGTPLTYGFKATGSLSVTMCSLDDPASVAPTRQHGIESKLPWVDGIAALPAERTQDWMAKAGVTAIRSHQRNDL